MACAEKGERIPLGDQRNRRRPWLDGLIQRRTFWLVAILASIVIVGFLTVWLAGGFRVRSIFCGIIAGTCAGSAIAAVWRFHWQQFILFRYENRLERNEREIERLFVVLLRHLRLPLRDMRQNTVKLTEALRSRQRVSTSAGLCPESEPSGKSLDADPAMDEEGIHLAEAIHRSAIDLDQIAGGLVRLGRIRKSQPAYEFLDMSEMIESIAGEYTELVEQTGATIEMSQVPPAPGDIGLIETLWRELIANAVQNLHPDRRGRIRIWGWTEGHSNLYCIQDNGIGIPEAETVKIFELFYRIDSASPRQGLGLALVRRILEKHHGRLWVESKPGKGSRFTFSLPVESVQYQGHGAMHDRG